MFDRAGLERQLDEELQFHLEMQAAAHQRLGQSPVTAYARARREFGSVAQHKDDYRDLWGIRQLEAMAQDLCIGARHAWSQRGTSLAIVLVLALGVGVSTAVFCVFNGVLIQPPPFAAPERLVRLQAEAHGAERLFSAAEIRDLRVEAHSLASVAEFHFMYFILLDAQEPRRVSAGVVSANFFDVIGVRAVKGRVFRPEEELAGAPGVIMLSHRFWTNELGGDPDVVGRPFTMNDRVHTVVGVLPPLPSFPEEADIYLPTSACPLRMSEAGNSDRGSHLVSALGRVVPTARTGLPAVREDLADAARRIQGRYPEQYAGAEQLSLSAISVHDDLIWRFRPTLAVLGISAGLLVLSLCSSIGALLLARAVARRREVAMRIALGAWRGRLLQQFVTECLLLTVAGAVAGLAFAHASLPLLVSLAAQYTSRASEIQLNQAALVFACALSAVIALVCGAIVLAAAAPGLSRPDVLSGRRDIGRDPVFRTLTVVQIAVSFALMVGAGLTYRSVTNLMRVDTGLRRHDIVTMRVSTDFIKYETPEGRAVLYDALLGQIRTLPGITDAAMSGALPLVRSGNLGDVSVAALDQAGSPDIRASLQSVSPDYFKTVGLELVAGRTFTADELAAEGRPIVVNRAMAARMWPGASAIGRRVRVAGEWRTVVGVVGDARQRLDEAPTVEVFLPIGQYPPVQAHLVVRTSAPPGLVAASLREAVRRAEPQQPIDSMLTIEDARNESVEPARVTAALITVFALIGVIISLISVAGVVGASVQSRTRELGLAMALGAQRRQLVVQVVSDGSRLACTGIALGALLSGIMARSLRGLLFEVSIYDPAVHLAVMALLLSTIIVACLIPARRAALVDPCVALRVG